MFAKLAVVALIVLVFAMLATPVHAGGVVTVCDEAHLAAALAGGGTVTFACSGVITLTAEIVISQDTTIDGAGQEVTISGGDAMRVFTVTPGAALNLNRLTVAGGSADKGGGLFIPRCFVDCADTGVSVSHSVFSGNSTSGQGSAMYINSYCFDNCGQLTITVDDSTFSGNSAADGGGAIATDGDYGAKYVTLMVSNSTFSNNTGGAILCGNETLLSVSDSTFSDNSGDAISTTVYGYSTVNVSHSTFTGNSRNGIRNVEWGSVLVDHSAFSSNSACGIANWDGALTVSHSTFAGNSECGVSNGDDGGIATVTNSTFSNNGDEGGDIINRIQGKLAVGNSTFANVNGSSSGGISNDVEGKLTVNNSTLHGVPVINSEIDSTLTLKNTIVASSQAGNTCTGVVTDGGGNLSYPDATCPGVNADPLLGPLQDNGGATLTMLPGPGSPAIDAGNNATCAAPPVNGIDQRGIIRPVGPACDIGAVEVNYLPWRRWLPVMPVR